MMVFLKECGGIRHMMEQSDLDFGDVDVGGYGSRTQTECCQMHYVGVLELFCSVPLNVIMISAC